MKSKKLFLPTAILVAAALVIALYSVVSSIAKKPTVTEQEFAFSVTYSIDGETKTINDVCTVRYDRNGGYTDTKTRFYVGKIGGINEENDTTYILQDDEDGRIVLNTKLYADYLMGDPEYEYFDDDTFEPQILYYDSEEIEYTDEETLLAQGVKLISWEYPKPIENSFVFSHISIVNGEVVLPSLIIAALALIATIVFVKKENDIVPKPIDKISTVCNIVIGFAGVPFFALVTWLSDITGDNESIFHQMIYFTSAFTVLCIAASVSLRRKGFSKASFAVQFLGPVSFLLLLVL